MGKLRQALGSLPPTLDAEDLARALQLESLLNLDRGDRTEKLVHLYLGYHVHYLFNVGK